MRVADYTTNQAPPLRLRVSYHSAADLLCSLWIIGDSRCGCALEDLDIGDDWLEQFQADLSPETLAKLDEIGSGDVWISLIPLLPETSAGGSVDDFIEYLAGMDPADVRYGLIRVHDKFGRVDKELVADAAEGSADAVERMLEGAEFEGTEMKQWRDTLRYLLLLDPAATRDLLVDVLRATQDEVFARHEKEFRPYLDADYRAKRTLSRRVSPERLLDIATSGINFSDSRSYQPIVLMPTMVARPWVVFAQGLDFFVLGYPVADEILQADGDAPPQWLVKVHKALGDEKRLRVLRALAEGDASLADLTEKVDIAKSTLHHHMMLLRAAGLVRVIVGEDKKYSLRDEAIGDMATTLDHYIHATDSKEEA